MARAKPSVAPVEDDEHIVPQSTPVDFATVPRRQRHDGWTADRQRRFITTLAEMGCISAACMEVGLSPSSAYRLRAHPDGAAFAAAWDHALDIATARLQTLAFDRAINGMVETVWKNGACVAERRRPDNRLLIYLLTHHARIQYGRTEPDYTGVDLDTAQALDPVFYGRKVLPALIDSFSDIPVEACATDAVETFQRDYEDHAPGLRA